MKKNTCVAPHKIRLVSALLALVLLASGCRSFPKYYQASAAEIHFLQPTKSHFVDGTFREDPGFWSRKPAPDATLKVIENGKVVREIEIYNEYQGE